MSHWNRDVIMSYWNWLFCSCFFILCSSSHFHFIKFARETIVSITSINLNWKSHAWVWWGHKNTRLRNALQMRTRRRKFRFHLFLTRWKCGNVGWPYGNPIQISVPVKSMQRHSFNFSFVLNFNLIGKFCVESHIKAGFFKKKRHWDGLCTVSCFMLAVGNNVFFF